MIQNLEFLPAWKAPAIAKIHISEKTEYKIRRHFPWLFRKEIDPAEMPQTHGCLVAVYGKRNQCVGIGLYDAGSPIAVRILADKCAFSAEYLCDVIGKALQKRLDSTTFNANNNGYRLINGESEGLPGIVIDRFDETWVMKVYTYLWQPYLRDILEGIETRFAPYRLVLRFGRECRADSEKCGLQDGMLIIGTDNTPTADFIEYGIRFRAHVFKGQKTGFFLDQRNNRQRIRALAKGKRVLDLCCFSGGFSLNAAAGGAREVWSLDGDRHALQMVRKHYELNRNIPAVAATTPVLQRSDVFDFLEKSARQRQKFDLIIADPPSFASSQAQIKTAIQNYQRLFRAAAACVEKGGQLLCCSCSSHVGEQLFSEILQPIIQHLAIDAENLSGLPEDHPTIFAEARYLKSWLLTIR